VTTIATDELYYDPWHAELNADPYPMFKRFRDAAVFSSSSAVRGWDSMPASV
jgi:hypothetical protein